MSEPVNNQDDQMRFSIMGYASEIDNVGRPASGTWKRVEALLRKRDVRPKKSGLAFAPVRMKPGATRAKENVLGISMAVADIDTEGEKHKETGRMLAATKRAPSLDELRSRINSYAWAAYSSHWHEPRRGIIKYRLVFPLSRMCTPEEWPHVWQGLNVLLGGHCDPACKDASRLYYLPSCPAESEADAFFEANIGKLLDPDALIGLAAPCTASPIATIPGNLQDTPKLTAPLERPDTIARVKSMLAVLPADCTYPQWRDTVWAIAATGWACAEELAREWSRSAPHKFDEEEFRTLFLSFKPDGGIGFGTLIHLAREAGWLGTVGGKRASSGDIMNGEEFARRFKDWLLFVYETDDLLKFETGTGWLMAPPGEADRAAKTVVEHFASMAAEQRKNGAEDAAVNRLKSHVQRSSSLPKIRAMIEMAKSEHGMTVQLNELDADPMLLGVTNGVLNLRAGELLAPSPALKVTRRCPVAFTPGATAPTLDKFISRITRGSPALAPFLQRWAGYALTGEVGEQCFAFLYGLGRNGKTTFAELLQWLLGDYAVPLPTATLMVGKSDPGAARPDLMLLKGRRLALASELEDGAKFAEAAIKEMTGGDTMTARNPYGLFASWTPTSKLMIVGNHKPAISGNDHGIWRRVLLIPFTETITDSECDDKLTEKLRKEGAGVLNWALAGLRDWRQHGLNPPQLIKDAVAEYRSDMDILKQWMDDHVQQATGAITPTADLYRAYHTWARESGWKNPMTRNAFGRRLVERGIALVKGGATNTKCACDIALNNDGQRAAAHNL